MKRKLFTLVLAASISVVSFTSCSKTADKPATNNGGGNNNGGNNNGGNNNGGGGNLSMKEKLVGSYRLTELVVLVEDHDPFDGLKHVNSCERDNLLVLKADMTSATIDAGEQCSPLMDETGEWSMPDNSTIVLDGETLHIDSMDGKTLKVSAPYEDEEEGIEGTLKMTMVKQ